MQALVLCRQPSRKTQFVVKCQQNQQALNSSPANFHSSTVVWNLTSRSTQTHIQTPTSPITQPIKQLTTALQFHGFEAH